MGSPPDQGRIVWATGPDPQGGNPKRRPWVVVSGPYPDGTVLVAAVTTLVGQAPFAATVPLPFAAGGHPVTKLKKPSEVVCDWTMSAPPADLTDSGGAVPQDLMADVQTKVGRLN
ncbi:MAG: type II toxin-antitoxin system PemK/MazF family toxin [Gemmataceae bacterium]|nr:type II toxin-antitoxin system PemK/MazF family toxin [Gemmataceae bacterium]